MLFLWVSVRLPPGLADGREEFFKFINSSLPSSRTAFGGICLLLIIPLFQNASLCGDGLPHTAQEKPCGTFDPLVAPGLLQGRVKHHGCHGGELQDLLLVPRRDPQKLERFAAVAHGFLLPPLPVGLSVLGVVFGDIVLDQRVQEVEIGKLEITLFKLPDPPLDGKVRIISFQDMHPSDVVVGHAQIFKFF